MSVNYDLYETPDLAKSGEEQPLHARVVLKGSYTAEEFVEQVTILQHMPHAQVVGVIEAISKELQHLLLKGFSVELGDIGYFTLSLSVNKKVLEPKDLRSPSISLRDKCLQRLNIFFEDHSCINRQDYAQLVGKTKKQALQDINAFIEKGILKKYGAGRSVVYIKVG